MQHTPAFKVLDRTVIPELNLISTGESEVRVQPLVMAVLVCLAEEAGHLVDRPTLIRRVWQGAMVSESSVTRTIYQLRRALADPGGEDKLIQTISKNGYRLTVPVQWLTEAETAFLLQGSDAQGDALDSATSIADADPVEEMGSSPSAASVSVAPPPAEPTRGRRVSFYMLLPVPVLLILGGVMFGLRPLDFEFGGAPSYRTSLATSLVGTELQGRLSPDGSRLAFLWDQGGRLDWDLFLKQVGEERLLRLTDTPGHEVHVCWSPGGDFLAFSRFHEGRRALFMVPALGGPERMVLALDSDINSLSWSPDGRFWLFGLRPAGSGPYRIFRYDLEKGGEPEALTEPPAAYFGDFSPHLRPAGDLMAFTRSLDGGNEVFVKKLPDGVPRQLTFDGAMVFDVRWAPDGETLLFTSTRDGRTALWALDSAGGAPAWTGIEWSEPGFPDFSVSQAGNRLSYGAVAPDLNVWSLGFEDPVSQRRMLLGSSQKDAMPSFSPDGSRIAFFSDRDGTPALWVSDGEGADPLRLTSLESIVGSVPAWSPDGSSILFGDFLKLKRIAATGGVVETVTEAENRETNPLWLTDGTVLSNHNLGGGPMRIVRRDLETGERSTLVDLAVETLLIGASENFVWFLREDETGLWRLPLSGGTAEKAYDFDYQNPFPKARGAHPLNNEDWFLTEKGLYFIQQPGGRGEIRFLDFASGRVQTQKSFDRFVCGLRIVQADQFVFCAADYGPADLKLVTNFQVNP